MSGCQSGVSMGKPIAKPVKGRFTYEMELREGGEQRVIVFSFLSQCSQEQTEDVFPKVQLPYTLTLRPENNVCNRISMCAKVK